MERSEEEARLGKLWRASRPQHRRPVCFSRGCNRTSASNHLLMQNGVISEICGEDRHVRELRTNRFRSDSNYYKLERVGWDNALTMYGYCAECDSRIFRDLENAGPVIPSNMATAAAYSLRPIVHEIRKKEGNLEFFSRLPREKLTLRFGDDQTSLLLQTRFEIQRLRQIYDLFWKASQGNADVLFAIRRSKRIQLCASAVLIRPLVLVNPGDTITPAMLAASPTPSFNVLNVFPNAGHLISISTCIPGDIEAENFNRDIETADEFDHTKLLTRAVVSQIEDWAVSEDLYLRLPNDADVKITSAKGDYRCFDAEPTFEIA